MEIPTHEILSQLHQKGIDTSNLKELLTRADLAKFAKAKPLEIENDQSLKIGYDFIHQTKNLNQKSMMWNNWTFYNPDFLYALALVPLLWIWYYWRQKEQAAQLQISTLKGITQNSWKSRGRHLIFLLRTIAIAILIVAFARPQSTLSWEDMTTEGIDIVISMDISGSMLAQDLKPDRLEASKNVAMDFISGRPNDRIGLVIFSGESFTQCPLTTDHQVLQNLFANVKSGMVEDGTAIGMGLATAVNRLKESEAISKVIILLTDGVNNQGSVAPLTAAKIAQKFGIRVYTIGVGTQGYAPYPFKTPFGTTGISRC